MSLPRHLIMWFSLALTVYMCVVVTRSSEESLLLHTRFLMQCGVSLTALMAVWLWLWERQQREWKRRRHLGLCIKCAHDLTGYESGVCPECGEPI